MRLLLLAALLALTPAPSGCTSTFEQRASERVGDLDREGNLVNVTVYNDAGRDVVVRLLLDEHEVFQRTFEGGSEHGDLHPEAALLKSEGARVRVRALDLTHDHETTALVDLRPKTYLAVVLYPSRVEVWSTHEPFVWM